jgi:hypothetical protein
MLSEVIWNGPREIAEDAGVNEDCKAGAKQQEIIDRLLNFSGKERSQGLVGD